ncbi:MAG: hypothetical protein H7306_21790 [Bacteriovorax sp.]|nr:hypothetical protein [Rhizobacter sp.]
MSLNIPFHALQPKWRALLAGLGLAFCLALIASCGGGDGAVGSGGTGVPYGVTQGTVNGFGSIVVDGVSYDDRAARVVTEVAPGQDVLSDVKLGDRVSLDYQIAGVAQVVRVESALAGPVASTVSATQFSMLGQDIRVNTSAITGPVTQFGGGYSQPGDVRAGDSIEVHGVVVVQGSAALIQATRIDKRASAPAYLRVTGVVANVAGGASPAFTLGMLTVDATGASLLPAGALLANGQTVTLLALPGTLTQANVGPRLKAAQIRVVGVQASGLDAYQSGSITQLDTQAKTFTLGSLLVRYAGAAIAPAGAPLENGRYVQVRGSAAGDGALVATAVTVRDGESEAEAELKGNITGYVSPGSFNVRGVRVDASRATLNGCPNTGLADGLYVEISGALGSNGVVAATVHCDTEPANATVEREGLANLVDLTALHFTLNPEDGNAIVVSWSDSTFFGGVTSATLSGKKLHAEGSIVNGVLVATQVKLAD